MSTKVVIEPGICRLKTTVVATATDDDQVKLEIDSMCNAISSVFKELGDTFDPLEICIKKPGMDPFYSFARENFPVHASCPTLAGIIKAIEVEAELALPCDATIRFVDE